VNAAEDHIVYRPAAGAGLGRGEERRRLRLGGKRRFVEIPTSNLKWVFTAMSDWFQSEVVLPAFPCGCHLVTEQILRELPDLRRWRVGLLHVFIRHTSASLTINENADPDVPKDLHMALDRLAPESWPWRHTCEGPDDMPAHVKATLSGSSISIPIAKGQLLTGTWQGIYLCEHRNHGGRRHVIVTIQGETEKP
jgi:secondary thiamine-phosphate synthase enzyme